MPMPYIISVLLFVTHEHIITHQHFFFTICFCMDDANFTYHPSLIIYYSSTHFLILFFLINTFPPHFGWLTLCSFSSYFFYLALLSFSLASILLFHPTHGLFCFILCYLSWVYTFSIMFIPHCKYFFLSSCARNMAHNAVNTRSQSLLHRKYTCTRPVRQMPFGVTTT